MEERATEALELEIARSMERAAVLRYSMAAGSFSYVVGLARRGNEKPRVRQNRGDNPPNWPVKQLEKSLESGDEGIYRVKDSRSKSGRPWVSETEQIRISRNEVTGMMRCGRRADRSDPISSSVPQASTERKPGDPVIGT